MPKPKPELSESESKHEKPDPVLILTLSELNQMTAEQQNEFRHRGGTAVEDAAKP